MSEDAPSLAEILQLTRQELTTAQDDDPIRECGRAALALLPVDSELALTLAYQKLHDVPYKEVKTCWRRLYTDASLWQVLGIVEKYAGQQHHDALAQIGSDMRFDSGGKQTDEIVRLLDMALIMAGAPSREELIELWFAAIKHMLSEHIPAGGSSPDGDASNPPTKRRKLGEERIPSPKLPAFNTELPKLRPTLQCPIQRTAALSMSAFQKKLDNPETHTPLIIQGSIDHWPALSERPWNNPSYLLAQTLGGRRLVPVEIGKSYTDSTWGQRIITFRDFMSTYMLSPACPPSSIRPASSHVADTDTDTETSAQQTGYLAQHDLFAQIPSLRSDICVPDYCYTTPPPSPHTSPLSLPPTTPLLNAWFGPPATISPLHTDPHHNILAQVLGYKYIRLYPPTETPHMYPRSTDDNGIDMANTSQVDLDDAMAAWPEISCWPADARRACPAQPPPAMMQRATTLACEDCFPRFRTARFVECVLAPGECLYIPVGWWHYVRSLTASFSVSFWF
ncbi:hypothetical protein ACN47E_000131 [Coniothyrium glycines]